MLTPFPKIDRVRAFLRTTVAFAMILAGGQAVAQDYPSRSLGGWRVTTSQDGNGCFLTRNYDRPGGTTLLLGLDTDGATRLTMLNANWSIAPRDRLELTFRLSAASFAKRFAVGIATGGKQGFVTSFDAKFPALFAGSRTLVVFRGDVPVERLNLDGSGAAVTALRSCVATTRDGPRTTPDAIPKDPFAADRR